MMDPKAATYEPAPLIEPGHTFASISDKIGNVVLSSVYGLNKILLGFGVRGLVPQIENAVRLLWKYCDVGQ